MRNEIHLSTLKHNGHFDSRLSGFSADRDQDSLARVGSVAPLYLGWM